MVGDEVPPTLQTELSSYDVYRRVAGGGFGTVHFGRDLSTNKPVAIKRLHPHLAYDPALVRRFEQEAQRLRGLQHINIVQVLDQGTDRGNVPFIILEWVDGWTLSSILERRGHLPAAEVVEIACQALDALQVANQRGIVHRDIKPSNLMLTAPPEQIVKVMDFGIAKDTLADMPGRQSHTQIGTLAYMAPEQFRGEAIDIRTDLYALGVTLYELLSGTRPYRDPLDTSARPLAEVDREIPPRLAEVVHRAMSRTLAQRFATPAHMRAALEPFRDSSIRLSVPTQTRPPAAIWAAPPAQSGSHLAAAESEPERGREAKVVATPEARAVALAPSPPRWRTRTLVALACAAVVSLTATAAGALALAHADFDPTPVLIADAVETATPAPTAASGVPTLVATPVLQPTTPPSATATSTPTDVPTSTPTPTAADAWQATLARLDGVWQTDWPASVQILDSYLQQYPDEQPALDKLYAALVEYGGDLVDAGNTDDGVAQLERARDLAPDRQEALDALLSLTPTPAAPAALATRAPARLPTSTPVRPGATGPAPTATRESGHSSPPPSATPVRSPTPVATQAANVPPTATPVKAATATPVVAPTHVTTGVTVVPTATTVRRTTPTVATVPTRVTSGATPTTRPGP